MYKYLQRYPNLSDFQIASFVPRGAWHQLWLRVSTLGGPATILQRYQQSDSQRVRVGFTQILPKTGLGRKVLEISEKNQGSWMILAMEDSFGLYFFLIGFRFQFKSISFRSYQKWWFPTTSNLREPVLNRQQNRSGRFCFHHRIVECIHMIC